LEDENTKLKKLLAEQMLDNAMLRDVNSKKAVTPAAKRQAVAHLCETHGVSQRRVYSVLRIDRSGIRYISIRPDETHLREAMKKVAPERRRLGYRPEPVLQLVEGVYGSRSQAAG
jgi:putative transposase